MVDVALVARVCHSVNKAYCESIGDNSQLGWEDAPEWQRESAEKGVRYALLNPRTPREQHAEWMVDKLKAGWSYGRMKNADLKTHPCLVTYDELSAEQKLKDVLFTAVVEGFRDKP